MYELPIDPDPNLRAGDADRDQTGDRLRHAHAEGRLDPHEFQVRIDRCYEAKTAGELHELVADLPGERPAGSWRSGRPSRLGRWRTPWIPILLSIFVVSSVIHATGHERGPGLWILIPLFFLTRFWIRGRWPWSGRNGRPAPSRVR